MGNMKQYKKSRLTKNGKKIAPPVSNKPRFNFIQGTHVSARGVETTVWRLPPAEMESLFKGSVMASEDSDDDSDDVFLQTEL